MRAVAYVSTATREPTEADLDFIVAESRRYNAASGVTGVLLYCERSFMQYFEGPEAAVAETYARIRVSRRHHRINEMMNQAIAEREFAQWTMGFSRAADAEFLALATARWSDRESLGPGHAMLSVFWHNCRDR